MKDELKVGHHIPVYEWVELLSTVDSAKPIHK